MRCEFCGEVGAHAADCLIGAPGPSAPIATMVAPPETDVRIETDLLTDERNDIVVSQRDEEPSPPPQPTAVAPAPTPLLTAEIVPVKGRASRKMKRRSGEPGKERRGLFRRS